MLHSHGVILGGHRPDSEACTLRCNRQWLQALCSASPVATLGSEVQVLKSLVHLVLAIHATRGE